MTARGFVALVFGIVMLAVALSIGNAGAYILGVVALIAWAFAFASVLLACLTCRVRQTVECESTFRGMSCTYHFSTFMLSPLPVAPLTLHLTMPSGRQNEFTLAVHMLNTIGVKRLACPHVGVFSVGVTRMRFSDCFGFFFIDRRLRAPMPKLAVLPNPMPVDLPPFHPGEGERNAVQHDIAEQTTPADSRAWQEGDELKRVHWKLSMRRQELMVRTYETPLHPDALIMLDITLPDASPRARAAMIDALTEGCAGIVKRMLDDGHPVHLSLNASRELVIKQHHEFLSIQRLLAQVASEVAQSMDNSADFARELVSAARRIRRTGSIVLLTSRLTPVTADAVIALRRIGTPTRLMLFTEGPLSDEQQKLFHLLQISDVETVHTALRTAPSRRSDY